MLRALLLLPLGACSYSLHDDMAGLRAEVVEIERQIPPDAPLWISDGPNAFSSFLEDGSPRVPEFLYLHLVRKLHEMDPRAPETMSQGGFDLEDARREPGKYRGRFWKVGGLIGELHAEEISDPKIPFKLVHAGVFFDGGLRPVLFHVVQKPDVLVLREDTVETTALFLKHVEYVARSGRKVHAPLFIGRSLRRTL